MKKIKARYCETCNKLILSVPMKNTDTNMLVELKPTRFIPNATGSDTFYDKRTKSVQQGTLSNDGKTGYIKHKCNFNRLLTR